MALEMALFCFARFILPMAEWFFNANLVWLGLPLLALPIIIHLINLMRHRRVAWAAMEFVLVAHKKSSTWILLKQLLLLILRILAIAAIIAILGQFVFREDRWMFGSTTHHIVVVDDTYSMSDKLGETSAFDDAKTAVRKIGRWASSARSKQRFTLASFSSAGKPLPELNKVDVATDFDNTRLRSVLDGLQVSQASVSPLQALDGVASVLSSTQNEKRVVYLVSDFRDRDWDARQLANLNERLATLTDDSTEVRLIQCVNRQHTNVGITSLQPVSGSPAAGVGIEMEVRVRNHGNNPIRELSVLLLEDGRPRTPVVFESIAGNDEAAKRFVVRFENPGQHTVTARISSDAVEADNSRFAVLDLPEGHPVLLIDGDQDRSGSWFIANALSPGEVRTGLRPQTQKPNYLAEKRLDQFQTIYVTNFHQLSPQAVDALEEYVRSGGGLALFMGPPLDETGVFSGFESDSLQRMVDFVSRTNKSLYRNGQGLLPAPLAADAQLVTDRLETAPDLAPEDHPIFRIFNRTGDAFLRDVKILSYYALAKGWEPDPQSTTKVIARLRNGAPLAIEHHFGSQNSRSLRDAEAALSQAAELLNQALKSANPTGEAASKQKEAVAVQLREAGDRFTAALAALEAQSQRFGDSKPQLADYLDRLKVLNTRRQELAEQLLAAKPAGAAESKDGPPLPSRILGLASDAGRLANDITLTEGPGGTVVTFLTTAGPVWNNWAANPSFVISALELQAYLAASRTAAQERRVGAPIEVRLDPEQYQEKYVLAMPGASGSAKTTVERAIPNTGDQLETAITDTGVAGIYELQLFRRDGRTDPPQTFAYNVAPEEGDLRLLSTADLETRVTADRVTVEAAADVKGAASQSARSNLTEILLYVLIALLLGEQILAYTLSYHSGGAARASA